eukprot:403371396
MRSLNHLLFTLSTLWLSLLAPQASFVQATAAGVAMAVDIEVVNQVKNYGMPMMIDTINNLDLGKIEFSQGNVDNIKFDLHVKDLNSIQVGFSGQDNAVVMHAQDISGSISGTFKFKVLFITATGKFKVRLDQGGCTMSMKVPLIIQNQAGRNVPGVGIKDFDFEIHSSKIHIDLSGGFIADIADPFIAIFKSLIIGKINKIVKDSIPDVITSKVNKMFAGTNGLAPFYGDLQADFTFSAPAIVSDSTLALFLNATLYNQKLGQYRIPNETITDVQVLTISSNAVQMAVSHYSADSVLVAIHDTGLFDYVITKEAVPGLDNMLTTTYLEGLLPGLEAKYGKDQPVTIEMKATQAPKAEFKENDLGLILNLDLTFRVNSEIAIIVSVIDLIAHVEAMLQGPNFTTKVNTVKIDQCSASQSQIGDFDAESFRDFFNVSVRIAIPFLNELFLSKAIVLPDNYLGLIKINSATFASQNGFLAVTVVPQIIA